MVIATSAKAAASAFKRRGAGPHRVQLPISEDYALEGLLGTLHCLSGLLREFASARDPVEVGCPWEFRCRVTVLGFVKEPPPDVVSDVRFFHTGGGQLQCLLLQLSGRIPAGLTLEGLGKYEQQFAPVGRVGPGATSPFLKGLALPGLSSARNRIRSPGENHGPGLLQGPGNRISHPEPVRVCMPES